MVSEIIASLPQSSWKRLAVVEGTDEQALLTVPEVRRLLAIALPLPVRSPELRLVWSTFRREARDSGPVEAITGDARSADALVLAPKRLHNYGCSIKRCDHANGEDTLLSEEQETIALRK